MPSSEPAKRKAQKKRKKRKKIHGANALQGGEQPPMEEREPTLKGPQLKRELEKMHIELELPTTQIQTSNSDKNRGSQVPPHNQKMENEMNNPTTENNQMNANPAAAGPADRIEQKLDAIRLTLAPPPAWKVAAGIGACAVAGVGVVALGTFVGTRMAARAAAPKRA